MIEIHTCGIYLLAFEEKYLKAAFGGDSGEAKVHIHQLYKLKGF